MEVNIEELSIDLEYREGSSDKVYNVRLREEALGWKVYFAYGRRGTFLNTGTKTKEYLTYEAARKVYDKLVRSKVNKGYVSSGTSSGSPINTVTSDKEDSKIRPQLLNEISEVEAINLIEDSNYCMQEKFDGRRRLISKNEGKIDGINKKGIIIPLTVEMTDQLESISKSSYIIDGEDMGDKIMLFDDLTNPNESYFNRFGLLIKLINSQDYDPDKTLQVVKTAWDKTSKKEMFKVLKESNAEGVVFKRIDAPYTPGRPASRGSQFKCKFYETASCIVSSVSDVKNSIALHVLDDDGTIVPIGNTTLYANSPTVKVGNIVEVKYLYYNEGGSLYQPVLLDVRDDVYTDECKLDKLKRKKNETT